jgi:Uma2 family endonuclease
MKNTEEKKTQHKPITYKVDESKLVDFKTEESLIAYHGRRYSYADYLTWADDKMREIIGGIVYLFSAPKLKHAAAVISFLKKALPFIGKRKGKCKIYTAPFDVRLPKNGETDNDKIFDVVQPDIVVICDPSKLDENGCIGAPDLIVEVLSPSTSKRDLNLKFNLYETSGVKEYWVVYPSDKAVTVFLLQPDGKYDAGTLYEVGRNTQAPVQTLEGLVIDLEELFSD